MVAKEANANPYLLSKQFATKGSEPSPLQSEPTTAHRMSLGLLPIRHLWWRKEAIQSPHLPFALAFASAEGER